MNFLKIFNGNLSSIKFITDNLIFDMQKKRVLLRAIEPSDVSILLKWENDPDLWVVSETFEPISEYKMTNFITQSLTFDVFTLHQIRLMIGLVEKENLDDVTIIGSIDLFDFDPINRRGGIGLMLDKAYRHQGFGKEALEQFLLYLQKYLHLHQVYANISENNETSIKLFEGLGFKKCGEKKDWRYRNKSYLTEFMYQYFFEN